MLAVAEVLALEDLVIEDCVVKDLMVVNQEAEDWELVGAAVVVLSHCEEVEMVVGSGVHSPTTQYNLPISRSGQVTSGFIFVKMSTEKPKLDARLSQLSPLTACISR